MTNLLSDTDLKIAKAEAAELWAAVNSRDVTGKVEKALSAEPARKAHIKKNFDDIMKASAMKHLTGQKFEPVQHKGPQPVGQPTRVRGFARAFGIAGGAVSVAQAPSYTQEYGVKRGAWELFKDVFDPFGLSGGQDPYFREQNGSGVCDPNGPGCA
ncbi:hypothetical protein KBZ10_18800 [Streptomyces sp. F63]|uniref:hypothetical protein n=1 Tax=Streptomyces sp. F63 TaxID=2824887 RepID=UPI001B395651|nr:hypothetical protein [Streptomyces sp. F63]MBQ0986524.1 hypothetical protein [Streptomyces sp. F63]